MVVTSKVVLTATMAFSFVIQVSLICSANAYPAEDFFFTDQPKIVHKRGVIERKKTAPEEKKINELKTIMEDTDIEDGGSGVGPDESGGVDPSEGSGSGFIEGSGVDTASTTLYNTGTEWYASSLPEITTTIKKVTSLMEQTETAAKEEIRGTSTVLPESTTTLRHGSSEKEETTSKVSTRLAHSSVTMADSSAITAESSVTMTESSISLAKSSVTLAVSSKTMTVENIEILSTKQLTTEGKILMSSTEDPNHLSTLSQTVLQTTSKETNKEILSTEMAELSTVTLGTEEQEPPSKLVSIQVCGKRFYCLAGRRGPCPANEILIEDINNNDLEAPSYCSALSSFPWRGCLSSVNEETAATTLSGRCNLKSTEKPCSGLPPNYRYHPIRKICRPTSISTGNWLAFECGEDQIFIGLNQNLGSCACLNQKHLIYIGDNQCYHPYTRGPCNKGMWLVPSSRREMDCRSSPCPANKIDGRHFYWKGDFHGPAGCYRTNTRGPCPEGKIFIVDDHVLGHARCELNRFSS